MPALEHTSCLAGLVSLARSAESWRSELLPDIILRWVDESCERRRLVLADASEVGVTPFVVFTRKNG